MQYVHGYSERESVRLKDQAETLNTILHGDTRYLPGEKVLEAGCGIGAQTLILTQNNPDTRFTSMDISAASLKIAQKTINEIGMTNVEFLQGDIFHLPFEDESFDHIFICFVLEHLKNPVEALSCLKRVLKKNGSITVIEGDHGSTYFHPHSETAMKTVECLVEMQKRANGNALIGRELYPLLTDAGFNGVMVSPRMIYVDDSKPHLVEGFTRNTFVAMVEGVQEAAISAGLMNEQDWQKGISDMKKSAQGGGTFCYTFFKAIGYK